MEKCDECGGKMLVKKVPFILSGKNLGEFEAFVCSFCGQQLFTEEVSDQIDNVAKEMGLWATNC